MCHMIWPMTHTTDTPTDTLTYAAAAARFGVSVRTLARLVASGTVTRYRSTRDKRLVLLDPAEVESALEDHHPEQSTTDSTPTVTATINVAEGATLLSLSAAMYPDVYRLLREEFRDEFLEAVTIVLGGADRLAELDTRAGWTPAEGA